jgi:NAD(P)-dependent dehydrogenase (short-subunit alcohol dehydrogenase family)
MAGSFDGRRVVITGGSGFLGSAVVKALLDAGATCEVTWRNEKELARLEFRDRVRLHQLELSDEAAVTKLYAQFDDLWASIHAAGAFAMAPVTETSLDQVRQMFDANAVSCFLCCREAVRAMRRAAGKPGGRIVNVAARPAVVPTGGMIAYSTSKAAVTSITQSLAEELKPEGIWVNAVLPSSMDTPANRKALPNADFSKVPKVEEVARMILTLASPENAITSGALVPVYGRA